MSPLVLFRRVAVAEAVTWALLLTGMVLKYVTETTELGVRVGGMLHGVVFLAYGLVTLLVWVDQRWTPRDGLLGLASAVPPFATIPFDAYAERRGLLGARGGRWRLRHEPPSGPVEQVAAWLLRHPARGALVGLLLLAGLTALALAVGPPVG
ncbi:DUF3817 domain-containing protein [Nocardioides perillae]|uniref:Integral membrane protein n=1 Tax=Nocardioides perillae TaxID=1119534 RepID=A0A7Y9RSK9_9ACTN|nr:integral membrane protein [Nocardioides perillae]